MKASHKALNIAPPGHEAAFSTLRDVLNKTHSWADPMEPDRARDFKLVRESADRAEVRQVIVSALYDQIDAGLITDRASMAASWLWTVQLTRSELTELGLTRTDKEDATWLVLDPTKTRLRTCTIGGRSVTCLKIEED